MTRKKGLYALVAAVVFGLPITAVPAGAADQYKVLHEFNDSQGTWFPEAGLVPDAKGDLYGTTSGGGAAGYGGAAFELTPGTGGRWTETVLQSLVGQFPEAGLIFDGAGNLYGTTSSGGTYGNGSVFELTPSTDGMWTETVLYSFMWGSDGADPRAGVIFGPAGNLYGTTSYGGADNKGTVFELTPNGDGTWSETILHSFNGEDGQEPLAGLVLDTAGNLYGTTELGGRSCGSYTCGTVFQLTPNGNGTWTETVLHGFRGSDGAGPTAGLIFDTAGNLYGTTFSGGSHCAADGGCGVVFELSPGAGGRWTHKVLHNFSGTDGSGPLGPLVFDAAGNLYSTTTAGGSATCWGIGCGLIFQLAPDTNGRWRETVLHRFNGKDGQWPSAGLVVDTSGNLYGTTPFGGNFSHSYIGYGVVFEVIP